MNWLRLLPAPVSPAVCPKPEQSPPRRYAEVMSHALDQDEFGAGNGLGRRSAATHVAHPVRKAVDDERRHLKVPQA